MKKDLRNLSTTQLIDLFNSMGQPAYRAKQLYNWLWGKGVNDISKMSSLPKELRKKLAENYNINRAIIYTSQQSIDGTLKLGFQLHDQRIVEGVIIPTETRKTACISSQVGCTLNCAFCATGKIKRERNLSAGEIYDQVSLLNEQSLQKFNTPLSNIVYMGMGEPLLNYQNVIASIEKITNSKGLGMSAKRITLSTVGIARGIVKLADDIKNINLAWSLHAASNEKRQKIMEINKSNSIEEVIKALQYYAKKTKNKITFEYILFNNFNDSPEDAKNLVQLYKKVPAFVNLIEYNKVEDVPYSTSSEENKTTFLKILENNGITAKIRKSRGQDIDAACGQLANKK